MESDKTQATTLPPGIHTWKVTFDDLFQATCCSYSFTLAAEHAVREHAHKRGMGCDGAYLDAWQ